LGQDTGLGAVRDRALAGQRRVVQKVGTAGRPGTHERTLRRAGTGLRAQGFVARGVLRSAPVVRTAPAARALREATGRRARFAGLLARQTLTDVGRSAACCSPRTTSPWGARRIPALSRCVGRFLD